MSRATLGDRSLFPELQARAYLNHAAVSPPSLPVQEAVTDWLGRYARLGVSAFPQAADQRLGLKGKLASLLGCQATDLALTSSTTHGLIALATCIPFQPGDRILLFDREFPANITPWVQAAAATGAQTVFLPQQGLDDDAVLAELELGLREGARLVAVSAVQFSTGRAMPLARITALAHAHGAQIAVDGIQAIGASPLNVAALGIDYLASGAHKWLMGLEGVGFVYATPRAAAALEPRTSGWLSHEDPLGFLLRGPGLLRYDRPIRSSIDFLEGHSVNAIGCVALEAALDLILELGLPAIQAHICAVNDALEAGLVARGFTSLRPADSPSGTLTVLPPDGQTAVALGAALSAQGISASTPDGLLRFSPHWPNAQSEVQWVLDALDRAAR